MKPLNGLFEQIVSPENLFRAADITLKRGRRFYGEGAQFKFNLEREVFKLHDQLTRGKYRHGRYNMFGIIDPKPRIIAAACFRDRVLHHAIHDVIAPRIDRIFIHDSYACRPGKGTHRALNRAHKFLRANSYFVHLDVVSYFQNIDHGILKGILRRYIADERLMKLMEMIIDSTVYLARDEGGQKAGLTVTTVLPELQQLSLFHDLREENAGARMAGLPLGNLTSQFFANLYLNEMDQHVKHVLKARYYIRYMDDMALFSGSKETLRGWEKAIRIFAEEKLKLTLHPSAGPAPVGRGLSFLGFRIFTKYRRLKRASVSRFIRRMRKSTEAYFALGGARSEQSELLKKIRQSAQSFNAHALNGNTYRIRKLLYDRFPIINQYGMAGMRVSSLPLRCVIPTEVGIHLGNEGLDSRFHGNDIFTFRDDSSGKRNDKHEVRSFRRESQIHATAAGY